MKRRNVLAACLCFVLGVGLMQGCSSKEDRALYTKIHDESAKLSALQQSEKLIFHQGKENESIVMVSYLPNESGEEEKFIIYGTPSAHINTATLAKSTLQERHPTRVRKVGRGAIPASLRNSAPPWFVFYRVSYPASEAKKMQFGLSLGGEKRALTFYKGPKYIINKKEFKSF